MYCIERDGKIIAIFFDAIDAQEYIALFEEKFQKNLNTLEFPLEYIRKDEIKEYLKSSHHNKKL